MQSPTIKKINSCKPQFEPDKNIRAAYTPLSSASPCPVQTTSKCQFFIWAPLKSEEIKVFLEHASRTPKVGG